MRVVGKWRVAVFYVTKNATSFPNFHFCQVSPPFLRIFISLPTSVPLEWQGEDVHVLEGGITTTSITSICHCQHPSRNSCRDLVVTLFNQISYRLRNMKEWFKVRTDYSRRVRYHIIWTTLCNTEMSWKLKLKIPSPQSIRGQKLSHVLTPKLPWSALGLWIARSPLHCSVCYVLQRSGRCEHLGWKGTLANVEIVTT